MIYVGEYSKFSSKSFIVSGLTFRFLIHFEFIFVYDVRKCFSFILFFFMSDPVYLLLLEHLIFDWTQI